MTVRILYTMLQNVRWRFWHIWLDFHHSFIQMYKKW